MPATDAPAESGRTAPADHSCVIFRTDAERRAHVADFVRAGLAADERVLCLTADGDRDRLLAELSAAGLDPELVTWSLDRDQLKVAEARRVYLPRGRFSPEEALDLFRQQIRRAEGDGYAGFRVVGSSEWAATDAPGTERLPEYERRVNRLLDRSGSSALCLYSRDTHGDALLEEARRVHSRVLADAPGAGARPRAAGGVTVTGDRRRPEGGRGAPEERNDGPTEWRPSDPGQLRALTEHISDMVSVVGRDGTVLYKSPSIQRVLGYPPGDRIGESAFELVHPDDREEARELFADAMREPGSVTTGRVRVQHADGRWRLLECVGRRPAGDTTVDGLVVTARDITERERRSERLRRLSRRLLRVREEERKELSRELHDRLGQQLTALRIQLEALAGEDGHARAGRARELVELVDRSIEEVQDLSRRLRTSTIDGERLVPALRELARRREEESDLRVRVRAAELSDAVEDGVAAACLAIVREALTNAIRHAEADQVAVELRRADRSLELSVTDDGRGFAGGAGGDGDDEDVGLGLTGMLERALEVDGDLQVDSEPGRGTRVRASLPLSPG